MTYQLLRPNGTLAGASYTVTPGGSAHTRLSDVNTGTYVDLTTPNVSQLLLDLPTFTLGTNEVVKSYRMGLIAKDTGAGGAGMYAGLLNRNTLNALPGTDGTLVLSTTDTTYWMPAVAAPLTQQQIDDLAVGFSWLGYNSGGTDRVSEVWAELIVAVPPTVQNTGPTVAQTVANPTLTASYTQGSDGGPQTKIRWKVFSAAQYGAGGFDPNTSPSTYDSGEIATASTTHVVATPLPSGVTYRAYVRGAHTINGVDYWSTSWHTNVAWTVTYTPTTITSVVPTPSNSTGSVSVAVNRNTGTPAWSWVTVERSDDAGTTWVPVRGATVKAASNTFLTWGANTVTVVDYEAPNGSSSIWRARAANIAAGPEVVGAWTQSTPATGWSSDAVWLKSPTSPTLGVQVDMYERAPELTYPIEQGVFPIVGSSTPVVVSDVRQAGTGQLIIETNTYAESVALHALLNASPVLLLQTPAGVGRHRTIYFAAGPADEVYRSVAEEWQVWSIPMQAVARPADDTP